MVVDPKNSRVLGVTPQLEPENNAVKKSILTRICGHYRNCDCLIHDRNCSFEAKARQVEALSGLKYYPIDRFHGAKHSATCKNSPSNKSCLRMRLKGVNTSVPE